MESTTAQGGACVNGGTVGEGNAYHFLFDHAAENDFVVHAGEGFALFAHDFGGADEFGVLLDQGVPLGFLANTEHFGDVRCHFHSDAIFRRESGNVGCLGNGKGMPVEWREDGNKGDWGNLLLVVFFYGKRLVMNSVSLIHGLCCTGFLALQSMVLHAAESPSPVSSSNLACAEDYVENQVIEKTAEKLSQSDVVLVAILYKTVFSKEGKFLYARVIESLRGDIPVDALVKWSYPPNNRSQDLSSPKTVLHEGMAPFYVLASAKQVNRMEEKQDDFGNASDVSGVYEIKRVISYFPRTESDPARAMQRLLRVEPARIVEEADEAKFLKKH